MNQYRVEIVFEDMPGDTPKDASQMVATILRNYGVNWEGGIMCDVIDEDEITETVEI
tara:strand:+ start:599 stop:769 length:171 start_codon:yes stop_codon:yes gene_type:complete